MYLSGPLLRDAYCRVKYGTGLFDYSWQYDTRTEQCTKITPEGIIVTPAGDVVPPQPPPGQSAFDKIQNIVFFGAIIVGGIILLNVLPRKKY